MNKKLPWLLALFLLATVTFAEAQQPKKVRRIGYLSARSLSSESTRIEAFHQVLRELGYVEGKTLLSSTGSRRESLIDSPTWQQS